ncbi:MAG: isocitrate/isopropylmalate dehydrogenase family protein [Hyphomicrobiaceae bacterium]
MLTNDARIAVFAGDGIGNEIIPPTIEILDRLENGLGGFRLTFEEHDAGAAYYRETGGDISDAAMKAAGEADAILLGAMGLPDVRHADGTEIAPHLAMRENFHLVAGVRPVKAYPNVPQRLADPRAADIDFIVLRESTEGLFYSRDKGEVQGDAVAYETLRISRDVTEELVDVAFTLARQRKEKGGKGRVTCVDKSNVFRAYAFFRKIFFERAEQNKDIEADTAYVDAMALDLIRKPWDYDVLVMENMFADILSDLGGGLVGGMGMAPCAEIGKQHALFQPAHGSAPDIAGQDKANPMATILSAALMLDWLGRRIDNPKMIEAADLIDKAVEAAFADKSLRPMEYGGDQGTKDASKAVLASLDALLKSR